MLKNKLYIKCLNYDFENLFKKKGYAYFTNGNFNLNIIGVRADNNHKVTNLYDDIIVVIYRDGRGQLTRDLYNITTEPGAYFMTKKLGNSKGTAILVPGQYRSTWKLDLHRGKYKALCQRKPVKVYRDGNFNSVYDLNPEKIDTGLFLPVTDSRITASAPHAASSPSSMTMSHSRTCMARYGCAQNMDGSK